MNSLDELVTSKNKPGFFKHVFNFDDESKNEMLNIVQYVVLAVIPVVIMNKLMQKYIPEADEDKGSLELSMEVLLQLFIMFLTMLFIHRIITYVPTYSGIKYEGFHVTNIILASLVIILSLQTKLGEKVSILVDRVIELWEGKKDVKKKGNGNGNIKVSQPISQNVPMTQSLNSMGSTSINNLPVQQSPDFNQMHQNDNTPLIGANSPGPIDNFEPMASNSGGGAFGSIFNGGW